MRKYLIKKAEEYTAKDGSKKTMWHTVGGLVMFDNDGTLRIPAIGLVAKVYPIEERTPAPAPQPVAAAPVVDNEINPSDIPF